MNKQKITTAEIEHIAALAQLKLTPFEIKKFQKQLSLILAYVGQLARVETQNVAPTSQVTGMENSFRKDEVRESLSPKEILSGAKEVKNSFFKVKAIF